MQKDKQPKNFEYQMYDYELLIDKNGKQTQNDNQNMNDLVPVNYKELLIKLESTKHCNKLLEQFVRSKSVSEPPSKVQDHIIKTVKSQFSDCITKNQFEVLRLIEIQEDQGAYFLYQKIANRLLRIEAAPDASDDTFYGLTLAMIVFILYAEKNEPLNKQFLNFKDLFHGVFDIFSPEFLKIFLGINEEDIEQLMSQDSTILATFIQEKVRTFIPYRPVLMQVDFLTQLDQTFTAGEVQIPSFLVLAMQDEQEQLVLQDGQRVSLSVDIKLGELNRPYLFSQIEFIYNQLKNEKVNNQQSIDTKMNDLREKFGFTKQETKLEKVSNIEDSSPNNYSQLEEDYIIDESVINMEMPDFKVIFDTAGHPILKDQVTRRLKNQDIIDIKEMILSQLNELIESKQFKIFTFLDLGKDENGNYFFQIHQTNSSFRFDHLSSNISQYYGLMKAIINHIIVIQHNDMEYQKEIVTLAKKVFNFNLDNKINRSDAAYFMAYLNISLDFANQMFKLGNVYLNEFLQRKSKLIDSPLNIQLRQELDQLHKNEKPVIPCFLDLNQVDNDLEKAQFRLNFGEKYLFQSLNLKDLTAQTVKQLIIQFYDQIIKDLAEQFQIDNSFSQTQQKVQYFLNKIQNIDTKTKKKISKLQDNFQDPTDREMQDQINNVGSMEEQEIDVNLRLEGLSDSLKELFKKSKSKLLLEQVTRKSKHTKKFTSLQYKIKSELQLMMNSKRMILYNFLLLSLDFRGYKLGYMVTKVPKNSGIFKLIDINKDEDYYQGQFKVFNHKILSNCRNVLSEKEQNDIMATLSQLQRCFDEKQNTQSADQIFHFVSIKTDQIAQLLNFNNEFINEYFQRRRDVFEIDMNALIISEVEYMLAHRRVAIPIFLIVMSGDPGRDGSKPKLFFNTMVGNAKFNKSTCYDITSLDQKELQSKIKVFQDQIADQQTQIDTSQLRGKLAELDEIMDLQQGDVAFRAYKQRNIVKTDQSAILQTQKQKTIMQVQNAEQLEQHQPEGQNSSAPIAEKQVDESILESVSDSCRNLFNKTTNPLLKEFVTRKGKLESFRTNIFSNFKNELNLMIMSERIIIYYFLMLTSDPNAENFNLGFSFARPKIGIYKTIDIYRPDEYFQGFLKVFNSKLMQSSRSLFNEDQVRELSDCIKKCQTKLDKIYNLHSPDYLHHVTKLKIDHIEYLQSIGNQFIQEQFTRKLQLIESEQEPDLTKLIHSELDYMIEESRIILPIFLTFSKSDSGTKKMKVDQILFNMTLNDNKKTKIKRVQNVDLQSLDLKELQVKVRFFQEFIIEHCNSVNKADIERKLEILATLVEDKIELYKSSEIKAEVADNENSNVSKNFQIDDLIIHTDIQEIQKSIQQQTTSLHLKEFIVRKGKNPKQKSFFTHICSEIDLMIEHKRIFIYSFLNLSQDSKGFRVAFTQNRGANKTFTFHRSVDIQCPVEQWYGLIKQFNYKMFSSDMMLEEHELGVLDEKLNLCQETLDPVYDLNSSHQMSFYTNLRPEYIYYLMNFKNPFIQEQFERKKNIYEPELVQTIETELDQMIKNDCLVVPIFCSFIASENNKEAQRNRIQLLNISKNDKIKKQVSFDIHHLDNGDLLSIIKTIYEYLLTFTIEHVNNLSVKSKLAQVEEQMSTKHNIKLNREIKKMESMFEDEEIQKLREYDTENLCSQTPSECYKVVFTNSQADIVKELLNRKFKNTKKNIPIQTRIKNELKLMLKSERLILYNFLMISAFSDKHVSIGFTQKVKNHVRKIYINLDISQDLSYQYGFFRNFNNKLMAILQGLIQEEEHRELSRMLTHVYKILDKQHFTQSQSYLCNFVHNSQEDIESILTINNPFLNDQFCRKPFDTADFNNLIINELKQLIRKELYIPMFYNLQYDKENKTIRFVFQFEVGDVDFNFEVTQQIRHIDENFVKQIILKVQEQINLNIKIDNYAEFLKLFTKLINLQNIQQIYSKYENNYDKMDDDSPLLYNRVYTRVLKPEVCHDDNLQTVKLSKNYSSIKSKSSSQLIKNFKAPQRYQIFDYSKLQSTFKDDLEEMIKSKQFFLYNFLNIIEQNNTDLYNFEIFIKNESVNRYTLSFDINGGDEYIQGMVKIITAKILDLEQLVQLDSTNVLLSLANKCFEYFDRIYDISSNYYLYCFVSLDLKDIELLNSYNNKQITEQFTARTFAKQDQQIDLISSELDSMVDKQSLKIPTFLTFKFNYNNDGSFIISLIFNAKIGNDFFYHSYPIDISELNEAKIYKLNKSIQEYIEFNIGQFDNASIHSKIEKLSEIGKGLSEEDESRARKKSYAKEEIESKHNQTQPDSYEIDESVLSSPDFSEVMKSLFRETTSPLLKEFVTRKNKSKKGVSIYSKFVSELQLCIRNKRVVIQSFLGVSMQGNNQRISYSVYQNKNNNAVHKVIDINRPEDQQYGFFKNISNKLIDIVRNEVVANEHKEIIKLYNQCTDILDKVQDVNGIEYLSVWVGNKIEQLKELQGHNNIIDEYFKRKVEVGDVEAHKLFMSELDYMNAQKRLVVPLFCSLTSDNKGKKSKIILSQIIGEEKLYKTFSFDLTTLDQAKLYTIVKNIYGYLENNFKSQETNKLVDKIIKFEELFKQDEGEGVTNEKSGASMESEAMLDDDDESIILEEPDIEEEVVKYHPNTSDSLKALYKDTSSTLLKEYATRRVKQAQVKNRPISKAFLSELKTLNNSGRLILQNFLEMEQTEGKLVMGFKLNSRDSGQFKPVEVSRTADYQQGWIRHLNNSLLAKLEPTTDNQTMNELQRLVRTSYNLLDENHDLNSNDQLMNFVSLNSDQLAFLKKKDNVLINEQLERRKTIPQVDWDSTVRAELDFMLAESRIVVPLFLTLCADNKNPNNNNKLVLMHHSEDGSLMKSISQNIDGLNRDSLWVMVKQMQTNIDEFQTTHKKESNIKDKLNKIDEFLKKRSRKDRNSRNM